MNGSQTTRAATADTVGGPLKFKQDQINPTNTAPPAPAQGPAEQSPNYFDRVVATVPKGRRNKIVVTCGERDGKPVIDIRLFKPNGLKVLMPTSKGIGNIDPTEVRALIAKLEAALDALAVQS
jgi:hypothetical protein